MLLKLDEPKLFVDSISIISDIVTEVKAKVTKNGLSITAFDPANVSLVALDMPASVFSQFEIEKDEILGLNLEDFKSVLRRISADCSLTIKKTEENMLHLEIKSRNESSFSQRNFSLALIAGDNEEKKRQNLEFSSQIEMDSSALAEAIADASVVSDACSLTAKKDSFSVEAKGTINKSKTEFNSNNAKFTVKDDSKSKYSLEYLQKFARGSRISDKVKINFSSDYPLQLEYSDKIKLSFILAPRVEED